MLTLITMVMSLGQGLWMALSAIYAVTVVGLSPGELGVALGVTAVLVLLSSIPLGHLADRAGPRTVQLWSFLALAPLTAALVAAQGFWSYLIAISAQGLAYRAGNNARKAMIAANVPREDRVHVMAYIRAAVNATLAVGACLAGLVLVWDERVGYQSAVLFAALCFLVTGLLTLKERAVPPAPATPGAAFSVLRDTPFLAFTVLDGALVTHALLLDLVLPLWVVQHTDAPRWTSAALLLLNTALVVALQTRAARGVRDPRSASFASLQGAGCVAGACLLFALTDGAEVIAACVLLGVGALLHAFGEIRQAAGSWTIIFDLAPDHAQGQYQGTYKMGGDIGKMFAPAVLTWLIIGHGALGWVVLAVAYAVLGAAVPAVVALGARRATPAKDPATV
jgi:MFS family permease